MDSYISGKFAMTVEIDFELLPKSSKTDEELKREIIKKTMGEMSLFIKDFNQNNKGATLVLIPEFINGGI